MKKEIPNLTGKSIDDLMQVMLHARREIIHHLVNTDPKQKSKRAALLAADKLAGDCALKLDEAR